MKLTFVPTASLAALLLISSVPAQSAPSANQICKRMIAEGRAGDLSLSACLCTYRVADVVLDDDIKSLMFEAWYNGTNNLQAIEPLPKQSRVRKQLKTMNRSLKANCGK